MGSSAAGGRGPSDACAPGLSKAGSFAWVGIWGHKLMQKCVHLQEHVYTYLRLYLWVHGECVHTNAYERKWVHMYVSACMCTCRHWGALKACLGFQLPWTLPSATCCHAHPCGDMTFPFQSFHPPTRDLPSEEEITWVLLSDLQDKKQKSTELNRAAAYDHSTC